MEEENFSPFRWPPWPNSFCPHLQNDQTNYNKKKTDRKPPGSLCKMHKHCTWGSGPWAQPCQPSLEEVAIRESASTGPHPGPRALVQAHGGYYRIHVLQAVPPRAAAEPLPDLQTLCLESSSETPSLDSVPRGDSHRSCGTLAPLPCPAGGSASQAPTLSRGDHTKAGTGEGLGAS